MRSPTIYFARAGQDGPIKIGYTGGDPIERIADLQTGCPWRIFLIGAVGGDTGHEAWLHATDLRRRVTAEGRAVLDAAGIAYASNQESAAVRADQVQIIPVNGAERSGGSSWQSLTRGTGSIEADYLNGEIVLMARERGIPVPVNEVLQRLANQAARDRRPPGSATPDEVLALAALPAGAE